jgi:hypothetical protein
MPNLHAIFRLFENYCKVTSSTPLLPGLGLASLTVLQKANAQRRGKGGPYAFIFRY